MLNVQYVNNYILLLTESTEMYSVCLHLFGEIPKQNLLLILVF